MKRIIRKFVLLGIPANEFGMRILKEALNVSYKVIAILKGTGEVKLMAPYLELIGEGFISNSSSPTRIIKTHYEVLFVTYKPTDI